MAQPARYAPAERLLSLGLALAESRGGLTLNEMAEHLGVGRRTAERLRDALHALVPGGVEAVPTGEAGFKRWRLPAGHLKAFAGPTLEELTELRLAAGRARAQGLEGEADRLERLAVKLESAMERNVYRRLEPDLELLLEASGVLVRPGPREVINQGIVARLREAVLAGRQVRLTYRRRDTGGTSRPVLHPYGFLTGSRAYLVGFNAHPDVRDHRLYVLANIEAVELLDRVFERDEAFSLEAFAARSFGTFWDGKCFDVAWRFSPQAAADARRFRFHPDQEVTDESDGSVQVRFTASGLTEMAWHLFTWGEHVQVLGPEALRERYRELLGEALATLGGGPHSPPDEALEVE